MHRRSKCGEMLSVWPMLVDINVAGTPHDIILREIFSPPRATFSRRPVFSMEFREGHKAPGIIPILLAAYLWNGFEDKGANSYVVA